MLIVIYVFFLQKELTFIFASQVEDVLTAAFEDGFPNLDGKTDIYPSKL